MIGLDGLFQMILWFYEKLQAVAYFLLENI